MAFHTRRVAFLALVVVVVVHSQDDHEERIAKISEFEQKYGDAWRLFGPQVPYLPGGGKAARQVVHVTPSSTSSPATEEVPNRARRSVEVF